MIPWLRPSQLCVPSPFPLRVHFMGLRFGKALKARGKVVWIGGGYVNTELRECEDERIGLRMP